ncbi:SsrA-binding protein SmpB [Patescibacteria group bacterium]|nr:SsrA-binding protein SmpB [Patescibacteria group bacterium]MBU1448243.1 SsrA-binding protein SmpB [Patescibacteria group bacterium]MBU2613691.1 SsrA-binding protein SmpB [Patescibacteria group bacterium]
MADFSQNRKARHDYETLESYEGGLELLGHEVKSVRNGGAKLTGAYLTFRGAELWLTGAHISRYQKAGPLGGYDTDRDRKVLLRRPELESLFGKTQQKGLTLVPFSLYPRGRRIKLSFGLCRGRKSYDKREKLKERDIDRDARREMP